MADEVVAEVNVNIDVSVERKKPRLLSLLFCDFASFTKDDKVNLLGVFDRIYVGQEEKLTPVFNVYIRTAEVVDGFASTIFGPDNLPAVQFFSQVLEQKFTENYPHQVQTLVGMQLKAEKEGVYWFDITHRGVSIGGAGLVIEHRKSKADKERATDTYV